MIAIAIDDEPIALEIVSAHAAKVPFISLQKTFTNAFEAVEYLQNRNVDIIFLDIKMPDISGIEFLRSLKNPPMVVFTTAYSEHAVQSFELDAVDYLLKPFSLSRFLKACNKAKELHDLRNKRPDEREEFIFIKDGYEQVRVALTEISYMEAAGNYTQVCLTSGKSLSTRVTISDMADTLPASKFTRVHRAFIVAKDHVTRYDRSQVWIGEKLIPIGTTYSFTR